MDKLFTSCRSICFAYRFMATDETMVSIDEIKTHVDFQLFCSVFDILVSVWKLRRRKFKKTFSVFMIYLATLVVNLLARRFFFIFPSYEFHSNSQRSKNKKITVHFVFTLT